MRKTRVRHGCAANGLLSGKLALALVTFLLAWSSPAVAAASGARGQGVPPEVSDLGITAAEWESLTEGEVVVRGGGRAGGKEEARAHAAGFVVVRAPWTAAFAFVGDHTRAPEYSRCTRAVDIVGRESRDGREFVKARETHRALWITMRYTVDFVHDPAAREIRWALDATARNDVKDNSGAWRFVQLPGDQTLVAYRIAGVPGKLPRFMLDVFVRKDLPRYLSALRRLVEAVAAPTPVAEPLDGSTAAENRRGAAAIADRRPGGGEGVGAMKIAHEGADARRVRKAVLDWIGRTNPAGYSGAACDSKRCERPFREDGCGGVNEPRLIL